MTTSEASALGWHAVVPMVQFVMLVAVYLLGMALLKQISR